MVYHHMHRYRVLLTVVLDLVEDLVLFPPPSQIDLLQLTLKV